MRYKSIESAYRWTANKKKMCNYGSVFASFIFQLRAILFPSLSYRGLIFWGVDGFNGGVSAFRVRGLIIGGVFAWRGFSSEFYGMFTDWRCQFFLSLLFYSVAAV